MSTLEEYVKNNKSQYNIFLSKELKKGEIKQLTKARERKQQILLITKLLNINQAFKIFNVNSQTKLSELRKQLTGIKASLRHLQIKNNGEKIKLSILYKNTRFPNFPKTETSEIANKLTIIILGVNKNGEKRYLFINKDHIDVIRKKLGAHIIDAKVKPLAIRRYMEKFNGKVEMMKILIGDEIGGVEGLSYITLEGKDVINGLDNFYRRYKYNTLRFHKIGVLEAIRFSNGLEISRKGFVRVVSIFDLLNFIKYL